MKKLILILLVTTFASIAFPQDRGVSVMVDELPVKPSRTISFTTDEGSYMNIDVSPDGRILIFDLLGDIYTLPVAGGKATQITRGLALNLRPIWSPDGKRFAYISDNTGTYKVHVRDISGQFHRILSDDGSKEISIHTDLVWSSDGNFLNGVPITGGLTEGNFSLLKYVRFTEKGGYFIESNQVIYRNFLANKDSILGAIDSSSVMGYVSPHGEFWSFISGKPGGTGGGYSPDTTTTRAFVIRNLKAGTNRTIASSVLNNFRYRLAGEPLQHFAYSPDSKYIYISYQGKIHRITISTGLDEIVPFQVDVNVDAGSLNRNSFRISQDSIHVKYTRSANVSPDGKKITFAALNKIYQKELPNGIPYECVQQDANQFQPIYSPDGKYIAYVTWNDNEGGFLWKVSSSGGKAEKLTHVSGQYQRPVWTPDGKYIAVVQGLPKLGVRDNSGYGTLELISLSDGKVVLLDEAAPLNNQIAFSKNGECVIYKPAEKAANTDSVPVFVSKSIDNKIDQVLVRVSGFPSRFLNQQSLSPDGKYLVFSNFEDVYLTPVMKGSPPIVVREDFKRAGMIRIARGVDPRWEDGGEVLGWTYANKYYRIKTERIIEAIGNKHSLNKYLELQYEKDYSSVNIQPDEIIDLSIKSIGSYGHGAFAFKNVRIITMSGNEVIENGTILVKNGRISAIGTNRTVKLPKSINAIDLNGATIIPGLIDLHCHMQIACEIFPQQDWRLLTQLAYGVTTALDPSQNFDSFGIAELLTAGRMIGPRFFSVGSAMRIDHVGSIMNPKDALELIMKRSDVGGKVIKQYALPQRLQRQWLLQACTALKLNMTNEGNWYPIEQIGMIKDGSTGIEHNPAWGDVYGDVKKLFARSGTYLTPALQQAYGIDGVASYFNFRYWKQRTDKMLRFIPEKGSSPFGDLTTICKAKFIDTIQAPIQIPSRVDAAIAKEGGIVGLGSHGNDQGIGAHNELWALKMGGLSNMEAIRMATINGAKAIGVDQDLGSLEVGKIADLIVLNKNPLDDIHNSREIRYVMKDGILYNGNTLDQIWPQKKKLKDWKFNGNPQGQQNAAKVGSTAN